MRDISLLLALPATLLTILASSPVYAQQLEWPYNLPRTVKYYPEHAEHVKRDVEVQEKLRWQVPMEVKKMGHDEGEKFYLGYWGLGGQAEQWNDGHDPNMPLREQRAKDTEQYNNGTLAPTLRRPIAAHSNHDRTANRLLRRNILERAFQCPSGTKSCASIGQSDLCCSTDETCVSTSNGVGCCADGSSCGSDISGCDTHAGYTSCPNSSNGGCCIPGASCEGEGCVFYGTSTVVMTLPTSTATTGDSFTTDTNSGTTVAGGGVQANTITETVTLTPSGSTDTTTQTIVISAGSTTTQASLTCTSGFFSCPASIGGGCCPNGQACGTSGECPDTSTSGTTAVAGAPILPTSVSSSESVTAAAAPTSTSVAGCPTGFYMCSARYLGGCCQVGRNCETTSCPPQDSTTLISSGVTVLVTSGADGQSATTQGSCANGWFFCSNGGCCPSGYQCGATSCTATNPGQSNTLKEAPSRASVVRWAWGLAVLGIVTGVGMVYL